MCFQRDTPLTQQDAFSTGSSFPRGFSSLYCIAVLKSPGDKKPWIKSTKAHRHEERSQHSPPGRGGVGKKRPKINKPTKFLRTRKGVSELTANYVKQWKNLYSSATKWSKMMTQRPQYFNQQDKSSLLFLCIFQSMESYCLINPLE